MFSYFLCLFVFLTDKNDRSSQPSRQNGCLSRDGRKCAHFALNHFRNLIPLYQPELAKVEIIYSFIEFQLFLLSVWLTLNFPKYMSVDC